MDDTCAQHHKMICARLGLDTEDSSYPVIKKSFIGALQDCAGAATDPDAMEHTHEGLAALGALYFDYSVSWHNFLSKSGSVAVQSHQDAAKLQVQAGAITKSVQNVIIQYASCAALLHAVIAALDDAINNMAADDRSTDIEWSYDLPEQVALMTKKRNILSDYMVRIRTAKPIVEKMEIAFVSLEKLLTAMTDATQCKKIIDEYTGLLRKHRYSEAEKFLKRTAHKHCGRFFCFGKKERRKKWDTVQQIAGVITLCVEKRAIQLHGRGGRLFLRAWEIKLAYDSMSKELEEARAFLHKYEIPEMRYRRAALDRQAESLARITTLDDLVGYYEDLLKGRFFPLRTLKDVRAFEDGALKKADFITKTIALDIKQAETAILKLSCGPDPENVPDDKLFENIDRITALEAAE